MAEARAASTAIHLWDVQGSDRGEQSWSNVRHFVLAVTMESALERVRAAHPTVVFHQAIRRSGMNSGHVLVAEDAEPAASSGAPAGSPSGIPEGSRDE